MIGGGRSDLIGVTGMITTLWEDYTISVYSSHLKKEVSKYLNILDSNLDNRSKSKLMSYQNTQAKANSV